MSTRIDRLITQIRAATQNDTANAVTDIEDNEIIEYINEAQHRIQSKILTVHPTVFTKEAIISAVAGTEEYDLPSDMFLDNKLLYVEYSSDAGQTYFPLKRGTLRDRQSDITSVPTTYIRRDALNNSTATLVLSPVPASSTDKIRVNYVQAIDELDIRRGIISAVTLDTTAKTITALTLDVSGEPPIDSEQLTNEDHMCIVSRLGVVKMRNVLFDSVSSSTGVVTVNSSFVYETGETAAVGDYIVTGKNTTTHSRLPKNLERYIKAFASWKIFKRDSSTDSSEQGAELQELEKDIIESYSEIDDVLQEISITEHWDE